MDLLTLAIGAFLVSIIAGTLGFSGVARGAATAVKDFLLGVVLGGTLGYLSALLFAPQSGEEMRAYLSDKSREVGQTPKETVETTLDKTGRLADEGRDRVKSTLQGTRNKIEVTKDQERDYTYEACERLSDTLEQAADEVDPKPRI